MNPLIQITNSGIAFSGSEYDLEELHNKYKEQHYIKLPNLLAPELLKFVQQNIEQAEFTTLVHHDQGDAGLDLRMTNNSTHYLLHTRVNDSKFLNLIKKVTGVDQLKYFIGRVYRMVPGLGHYDNWHSDTLGYRILTMSINLSTDVYSGGILKIRDKKTKEIIQEVGNTGFGDTIIFPIYPHQEHMLTKVEGSVAKTAFAGWFNSQIDYHSFLKKGAVQTNKNTSEIFYPIHDNSTILAAKGLLYEEIDKQKFIFNTANETCYGLNPLGVTIWNLLQEPVTIDNILEFILREYEVNIEEGKRDLFVLLQELAANKLIAVHEEKALTSPQMVTL